MRKPITPLNNLPIHKLGNQGVNNSVQSHFLTIVSDQLLSSLFS